MLKKNLDTVIVGKNYISYLLGFQLLNERKDILILGDKRIPIDDNHFKSFSPLELYFVKSWGEDLKLSGLSEFKELLNINPFFINIKTTKLLLGRESAYSNVVELARKFPDYFLELYRLLEEKGISAEKFDADYKAYCKRIGSVLCRFKTIQNINIQTFLSHAPDYLKELFEVFYSLVKSNLKSSDESFEFLVYCSRVIFHDAISKELNDIESFHLFILLLGPRYGLDTDKLIEKLERQFEDRGGSFRNSQIREWKFYKSKPWCIELDSFEGIVHPKKISFIGGRPFNLPLELNNDNIYRSYELVVDKPFYDDFQEFHFRNNFLGGDIPFWMTFKREGKTVYKVYYKFNHCEKEDFIINDIANILIQDGQLTKDDIIDSVTLGKEVISGKTESTYKTAKSRLIDTSNPLKKAVLKDVYYTGPSKNAPFGLLSTLLEVKDYREFI